MRRGWGPIRIRNVAAELPGKWNRVACLLVAFLLAPTPTCAGEAPTSFIAGAMVEFSVGFDAGVQSFAMQDMNHDNLADIVALQQITGGVAVLLNQGDGTFGAPQSVVLDVFPTALVVADLSQDGDMDVAVTDADGGLSLLFGSDSGAIQLVDQIDPGLELYGMTAGDFDEDGAIDLALLELCDEVVLQRNLGNGFFDCFEEDLLETGSTDPIAIASGDVNGDRHADLVVLNRIAENVSLFRGNGDGTFQPSQLVPVGTSPRGLAIGRVNADLLDDVIVVEAGFFGDNVTILLGDATQGLMAAPDKALAEENATSIALADFNGDRCLDFVSSSLDGPVPAIGLGDCSGRFGDPVVSAPVGIARAVAVGLVDNDRRLDFVVLDDDGEKLSVALNRTAVACAGDCDGDGRVTVDELVTGVNIALNRTTIDACRAFDTDGDGRVTVNELVRGVGNLLRGCGVS